MAHTSPRHDCKHGAVARCLVWSTARMLRAGRPIDLSRRRDGNCICACMWSKGRYVRSWCPQPTTTNRQQYSRSKSNHPAAMQCKTVADSRCSAVLRGRKAPPTHQLNPISPLPLAASLRCALRSPDDSDGQGGVVA